MPGAINPTLTLPIIPHVTNSRLASRLHSAWDRGELNSTPPDRQRTALRFTSLTILRTAPPSPLFRKSRLTHSPFEIFDPTDHSSSLIIGYGAHQPLNSFCGPVGELSSFKDPTCLCFGYCTLNHKVDFSASSRLTRPPQFIGPGTVILTLAAKDGKRSHSAGHPTILGSGASTAMLGSGSPRDN